MRFPQRGKKHRNLRDAQVFTLVPGAVAGLGDSSGFTMQFQNTQRPEPPEQFARRARSICSPKPRRTQSPTCFRKYG